MSQSALIPNMNGYQPEESLCEATVLGFDFQ